MNTLTESVVGEATIAYPESLGWGIVCGPDLAPDTESAERTDYGDVVLAQRLQNVLARLNPDLPNGALDDAFRKLIRPDGPTLEAS